jgi:hypothetical protein
MAFGKVRYVVEDERRVAHLPLIDVDEAADLLLGLGAFDRLQLPGIFDVADPVP